MDNTAQLLKEQLLRSEGYAEGFRAGYAACTQFIALELGKKEAANAQDNKGTAEKSKTESN